MNTQEERTFTFKTNINCGGCIAKIGPVLDNTESIKQWSVDTENPNKILTVIAYSITEEEVMNVVKTNGFKIESID